MTIVLAGKYGEEVHFCYDTATYNGLIGVGSTRKVKPIGQTNVALGIAGTPLIDPWDDFRQGLLEHPAQSPEAIFREFILKYHDDYRHMPILLGVAKGIEAKLFVYCPSREPELREVEIFGIGGGMYPEVIDKLNDTTNVHSISHLIKHLEDTVRLAKELDKTRRKILYGFGRGVLNPAGYNELEYLNAKDDFNEKSRK